MAALITFDLMGGDNSYHYVDDDMWEQIKEIHSRDDLELHVMQELISALMHPDEPDCVKFLAKHGYVAVGKVIASYYTQNYVIEEVAMSNIRAILTFQER